MEKLYKCKRTSNNGNSRSGNCFLDHIYTKGDRDSECFWFHDVDDHTKVRVHENLIYTFFEDYEEPKTPAEIYGCYLGG